MKETKISIPFVDNCLNDLTPVFIRTVKATEEDTEFLQQISEIKEKKRYYKLIEAHRKNPDSNSIDKYAFCVFDIGSGTYKKYPQVNPYEILDKEYHSRPFFWSYKNMPKCKQWKYEIIDDNVVLRFFVWRNNYFEEGVKKGFYELFRILINQEGCFMENRESIKPIDLKRISGLSPFFRDVPSYPYLEYIDSENSEKEILSCATTKPSAKVFKNDFLNKLFVLKGYSDTLFTILDTYNKLYTTKNIFKSVPKCIVEDLNIKYNYDLEYHRPYSFTEVEQVNDTIIFHTFEDKKEIERIYLHNDKVYTFGYNFFLEQFVSTTKKNLLSFKEPTLYFSKPVSSKKIGSYRKMMRDVNYPVKFAVYAEKYPLVEQMYKLGFLNFINDFLAIGEMHHLKKNEKKIPEYIKNGKSIKKLLKVKNLDTINKNINFSGFSNLVYLSQTGTDINQRIKIVEKDYQPEHFKTIVDTFIKNNKNVVKFFENIGDRKRLVELYYDYLKNIDNANKYKETDFYKEIIKPSDISYMHNMATRDAALYIELSKTIEAEKQFTKAVNRKQYKALLYENEEFEIIRPASFKDLKREGIYLHHCVGTYFDKIIKKESMIYFLRKKSDLFKPFMTIEVGKDFYKDLTLKQCKGEHNSTLVSKECRKFLDQWKKEKGISYDYENNPTGERIQRNTFMDEFEWEPDLHETGLFEYIHKEETSKIYSRQYDSSNDYSMAWEDF